jgi:hypothetical protein
VNITSVEFVPSELTFKLDYEDGSHGSMQLVEVTRDKLVLRYKQDRARGETQPLAAIRSMYVSDLKADVAEVTLQNSTVTRISDFTKAQASEVAFCRSVISNHNPSAPDMWFGEFTLTPASK